MDCVPNTEKFRRIFCMGVSFNGVAFGDNCGYGIMAWRVLRLRMEEGLPDTEGSCEYIE
jgi:hypothetical protein